MATTFLFLKVQCFHPITTSSVRSFRLVQRVPFSGSQDVQNLFSKRVSESMIKLQTHKQLQIDDSIHSLNDDDAPFNDEQPAPGSELELFGIKATTHKKALRKRPSRILKEELVECVPNGEPMPYASEYHTPVMAREIVELLVTDPDGVYIDGTLGGGGHSEAILDKLVSLGGYGRLIGIDRDSDAIDSALRRYQGHLKSDLFESRFTASLCDFKQLPEQLLKRGSLLNNEMPVDQLGCHGILLDLGVSSHQIDDSSRGFSYMRDGPLDMRMGTTENLTAEMIVNEWSSDEIARILWEYGDERRSRFIAKRIVDARPITTTGALASVVRRSLPPGPQKEKYKCLSRVFQALRIAVNDEMGALETMLLNAAKVVRPGGRIVVLSYHSLEDKRVKCVLRSGSIDGVVRSNEYGETLSPWKPIRKVPKFPSKNEIATNVRARSAKLRASVRTDFKS